MKTHRLWTTATLCWFFTLFNIERIVPAVNLASYVYCLATVAGISMLAMPQLRRRPFALTSCGFGVLWIVGKCLLGYSVDLHELPVALTEVLALVISQVLCLKVAQNTDEFDMTSAQLLDVLRAATVGGLRECEPQLLEEIRRARRHERPLTFVALNPGSITPAALSELVRTMEASLSKEYLIGCISRILRTTTKSHDLAVRVGHQFLMMLPETSEAQAKQMAHRVQCDIENQLGISIESTSYAFGVDELTLSGILERMNMNSPENEHLRMSEVFDIRPRKQFAVSGLTQANAS